MNISITANNSMLETHIPDTTRYAADLFLQLSPDEQKSVIDLIKSLLSEQ